MTDTISSYSPLEGEPRVALEKEIINTFKSIRVKVNDDVSIRDFGHIPIFDYFSTPPPYYAITTVPNLCMTQYDPTQHIVKSIRVVRLSKTLNDFLRRFILARFNITVWNCDFSYMVSEEGIRHQNVIYELSDIYTGLLEQFDIETDNILKDSKVRYVRNTDKLKGWTGFDIIFSLMARMIVDLFNSNIDKIHRVLVDTKLYVPTSTKIQEYIKGKIPCSKQPIR